MPSKGGNILDYVLKAKALTKICGHHKTLDDFSMNIPKGSIYGLVGKNGAGKTTLLWLICGLQEATSGDYTVCTNLTKNSLKSGFSSKLGIF